MNLNKPGYVNKYTLEIDGIPATKAQIQEWVDGQYNLGLVTGKTVLHWYPSEAKLVMAANQSISGLVLQPDGYEITVEAVEA